jgi:hypothetical protein
MADVDAIIAGLSAAQRARNAVERAITTAQNDLAHIRVCRGCEGHGSGPHETLTFERYLADLRLAVTMLEEPDAAQIEAAARAIAALKRGVKDHADPEIDRIWHSYVGAAKAAVRSALIERAAK